MKNESEEKQSSGISNALYEQVVTEYRKGKSVRDTATACGVSVVTAQRILITAGLWSSKTSREVMNMLTQGRTIDQIMEEMHLSRNGVYAYLPYSRGMYGVEETEDAQYSKEYRERMEVAAEGMRGLEKEARVPRDAKVMGDTTETQRIENKLPSAAQQDPQTEEQVRFFFPDWPWHPDGTELVYRLHLSLSKSGYGRPETNLGLQPDEYAQLLRLAKAKEGITRDILVRGDMNLHALHYCLQRLFGWQNSHLHEFSLTKEDFELFTQGKLGRYLELCGVLFRLPNEDMEDIYWDDDYEPGQSVKSWFARKYRPPYLQQAVCDSWLGNHWATRRFRQNFPQFSDEMTLNELLHQVDMGGDPNCLTERLTMADLFMPGACAIRSREDSICEWRDNVEDQTEILEEMPEKEEDALNEAAYELGTWRRSMDWLCDRPWENPEHYQEEVEAKLGVSFEWAKKRHEKMIKQYQKRCRKLFEDYNVTTGPYFDTINYEYDFGDAWIVKIEAAEVYKRDAVEEDVFLDSRCQRVDGETNAQVSTVCSTGRPLCVEVDGICLLDDCGGINGFLDMLRILKGENADDVEEEYVEAQYEEEQRKSEREETRRWARSQGWTGRKVSPEKFL